MKGWRRHRIGSFIARLLMLAIVLVLAWRFLGLLGWTELFERIRSALGWPLWLAVAALVGRGGLIYARWRECLVLLPKAQPGIDLFAAQWGAIFLNHVTPTARLLGGVYRARYLSQRRAVQFAEAYGVVFVDQTAQQLTQAVVTWLALAALSWALGMRGVAVLLASTLAGLVAGLLLWRMKRRRRGATELPLAGLVARWMERRARRLGPLLAGGRTIVDLARVAFADRTLQTRLALLAIAVVVASGLAQWLVFRSLGTEIDFLFALVVVAVGVASGVLTGTPGGVGTTEVAMIAAFTALGSPEIDATAGTLLFRGLHYLVVFALGIPGIVYCQAAGSSIFRDRDRSDRARPPADARPDDEARSHRGA